MNRLVALPYPYTRVLGLAKALIAMGLFGTLAFSSVHTLFRPVYMAGDHPQCLGVARLGAFCLADGEHLVAIKLLVLLGLAVVVVGWQPRYSSWLLPYSAFSVFSGISIPDGGDQIAGSLSVLLAVASLGDPRTFHWQSLDVGTTQGKWTNALTPLCYVAVVVAKIQVVVVYFQSGVAKLSHAEWQDGTALYYWFHNPTFGGPGWLYWLLDPLSRNPITLALLTWVPLVIEISLAVSPLVRGRARYVLLLAGMSLHLFIAVFMGLWSFAFSMWAALLILCLPVGLDLRFNTDLLQSLGSWHRANRRQSWTDNETRGRKEKVAS